jgi:trk system potassium uptake protein TrkA
MYIVIAGGGKVGERLARDLIAEQHEVVLLEIDPHKANYLEDDLGSTVIAHDAAEGRWLIEAGVARADLLIAVTGDDEDNIIICQMGTALSRGHTRTIARINNSKNSDAFRDLGIEAIVDATDLVMSTIERDVSLAPIVHLMRLRKTGLDLVEIAVGAGSAAAGSTVDALSQTEHQAWISVILRGNTALLPTPTTMLEAGDSVILVVETTFENALREEFAERTLDIDREHP